MPLETPLDPGPDYPGDYTAVHVEFAGGLVVIGEIGHDDCDNLFCRLRSGDEATEWWDPYEYGAENAGNVVCLAVGERRFAASFGTGDEIMLPYEVIEGKEGETFTRPALQGEAKDAAEAARDAAEQAEQDRHAAECAADQAARDAAAHTPQALADRAHAKAAAAERAATDAQKAAEAARAAADYARAALADAALAAGRGAAAVQP